MRSSKPVNEHALTHDRILIRTIKTEFRHLVWEHIRHKDEFHPDQLRPHESAIYIAGVSAIDIADQLNDVILTADATILRLTLQRMRALPNGKNLLHEFLMRVPSYHAESVISDIIDNQERKPLHDKHPPNQENDIQILLEKLLQLTKVELSTSIRSHEWPLCGCDQQKKISDQLNTILFSVDKNILGIALFELMSNHANENLPDILLRCITNKEAQITLLAIFDDIVKNNQSLEANQKQICKNIVNKTLSILKKKQVELLHKPFTRKFDLADNNEKQNYLFRAIIILEKLKLENVNLELLDKTIIRLNKIILEHKTFIDKSTRFFKPSYGETHIALCNAHNALVDLQNSVSAKLVFKR